MQGKAAGFPGVAEAGRKRDDADAAAAELEAGHRLALEAARCGSGTKKCEDTKARIASVPHVRKRCGYGLCVLRP